jgi:hypothetical protein
VSIADGTIYLRRFNQCRQTIRNLEMSLLALVVFACIGSFTVAGLALAVYASLPEKLLNSADLGRYADLTASEPAIALMQRAASLPIGSLQNQSA